MILSQLCHKKLSMCACMLILNMHGFVQVLVYLRHHTRYRPPYLVMCFSHSLDWERKKGINRPSSPFSTQEVGTGALEVSGQVEVDIS